MTSRYHSTDDDTCGNYHSCAALFPLLEGEALTALADDIRVHGLREPIWLYEGLILDGRNRERACKIVAVEPRYEQYTGDDPIGFSWSMNGARRHLNAGQLAAAALEVMYAERAALNVDGRPRQDAPKPVAADLFPMLDDSALEDLTERHRISDTDGLLLAEIAPSARHLGYWHITVFPRPFGDCVATKRPVLAPGVNFYLQFLSRTVLQDGTPGAAWVSIGGGPRNEPPWCGTPDPVAVDGDVYLIGPVDGGLVKVGVATSVPSRLAEIQRMSPVPLRVIATIPDGGYVTETRLHQRFTEDRSHGEWFRPSVELYAEFGV